MIKKIAVLGPADALKTRIIIQELTEMDLLHGKEIFFFTTNNNGKCLNYCINNNIKIVRFNNKNLDDKESEKMATDCGCDLLISAGWEYKIPLSFLTLFSYTPINCHGSILPDYRGSRAYMHYWANIEEYYGATIHYLNEEFDDGNIIIQGRLKLFIEESPTIVHRRTSELCAQLLAPALLLIENGCKGTPQVGKKRYFKKTSKKEFKEIRKYNETHCTQKRKLTLHTILD